jgi:hypothetical protein
LNYKFFWTSNAKYLTKGTHKDDMCITTRLGLSCTLDLTSTLNGGIEVREVQNIVVGGDNILKPHEWST